MIVRDEAANIATGLPHIVPLVDELIVVDTGSRDDTKAVAKRLGARVYDFSWCDDFSSARNHALTKTKADWILSLDADDRIEGDNGRKLAALLARDEHAVDGYFLRSISTNAAGVVTFVSPQVRLFRNCPRHRWRYRVHEQILPSIEAAGGLAERTAVDIRHVGYEDPALAIAKQRRNLRLLIRSVREHARDPFLLLHKATAHADLGELDAALDTIQQCRVLELKSTDALRLCTLNVEVLDRLGRIDEAIAAAQCGLDSRSGYIPLLFAKAELHIRAQDQSSALACIEALLQRGSEEWTATDSSISRYERELWIGVT